MSHLSLGLSFFILLYFYQVVGTSTMQYVCVCVICLSFFLSELYLNMSKSCFYNMDVNLLFCLMVKMDSVIYI